MAITLDNSSQSGTSWASGTSMTWSHTNTAGDYLVVGLNIPSSDNITGVTYNSVAMTQLAKYNDTTATRWFYIYGLAAPATGANSIVASFSGSNATMYGAGESLTGCKQTGQPDSSVGGKLSSSPHTESLTTTVDGCWLVGITQGRSPIGAGSSTTLRKDGTSGTDAGLVDSNGVKSPAGSYSLSVTSSSGGSNGLLIVAIAPPSSSPRSLLISGIG